MNIGAVPDRERITSIDILRGFAVLGILLMNIQSFSMVDMAYDNPHVYGDLSGANYWVWYLCHLFADQKFMSIDRCPDDRRWLPENLRKVST